MLQRFAKSPTAPTESTSSAWSVRSRLLALTVGVTCCLMCIGAAVTYLEGRAHSQRMYDDSLRETGGLLLQLAQHEIEEHGLSLGEALLKAETLTGAFDFRFQIWSEDMRAATRSGHGPAEPFMPLDAAGLGWTQVNGQTWRAYSVWNKPHTLQLQTAESLEYRQALPQHLFWRLAVVLALLLPLSAALLWWIIANSFRTVSASAQAVAARAPDDLRAVDARQLPQEMAPLLSAFNRLLGRMRDTLAHERRFTADAAHELRTPLAAIRANAQVMQGARSPQEFTTACGDLLASVDRGGRLIEQLLALTRVDSSANLTYRFESLDLAALIHAQVAEHDDFSARRSVEVEASAEPARVHGDRDLLTVLLRNLIDNAIRYSNPNTRVIVACSTYPDRVELMVNDEGVGIAPAERARVFERFYRISGAHDYGSGLGLSIVRRIVDLHGAKITVGAGAEERGTCFTVSFPLPSA